MITEAAPARVVTEVALREMAMIPLMGREIPTADATLNHGLKKTKPDMVKGMGIDAKALEIITVHIFALSLHALVQLIQTIVESQRLAKII